MDGDNGEKQNQQPREVVVVGSEGPVDLANLEFLAAADNTAGLDWLKAKFGSLAIRSLVDSNGNPKPPFDSSDISALKLQKRIPATNKCWSISVYTDSNGANEVLVSSPGEHLYGVVEDFLNSLDPSKKPSDVKPKIEGTHVLQGWNTAHDMVYMGIKEYGWKQLEILPVLSTSIRMSFAASYAAVVVYGLAKEAVRGYDILPEDEEAMKRIKEALPPRPTLSR